MLLVGDLLVIHVLHLLLQLYWYIYSILVNLSEIKGLVVRNDIGPGTVMEKLAPGWMQVSLRSHIEQINKLILRLKGLLVREARLQFTQQLLFVLLLHVISVNRDLTARHLDVEKAFFADGEHFVLI